MNKHDANESSNPYWRIEMRQNATKTEAKIDPLILDVIEVLLFWKTRPSMQRSMQLYELSENLSDLGVSASGMNLFDKIVRFIESGSTAINYEQRYGFSTTTIAMELMRKNGINELRVPLFEYSKGLIARMLTQNLTYEKYQRTLEIGLLMEKLDIDASERRKFTRALHALSMQKIVEFDESSAIIKSRQIANEWLQNGTDRVRLDY